MSEKQIAKMLGALVEHQSGFEGMSTVDRQWVIQNTKKAITLFADAIKNRYKSSFRRVDNEDGTISFFIKANRSLLPQQMLDDIGRKQYTNPGVVADMPRGKGDREEMVEAVFFPLGRLMSDDEVKEKREEMNLAPTDPYLVAEVNKLDPAFADDHPNFTHWKDANGKRCYLACRRWSGERFVNVRWSVSDWFDYWWSVGLRKSTQD